MPNSSLRSSRRSPGAFVVALVALGALLVAGGASSASGYTIGSPVLASGPSPFATCTTGGAPGDTNFVNTEVEPYIAVNPTDASNLIGVYQQDRWAGGGAHGLVASRSANGGQSWAQNFAAFDACSGGTGDDAYDRASDPWVTFDPDGNAYQISLSFSADQTSRPQCSSRSRRTAARPGMRRRHSSAIRASSTSTTRSRSRPIRRGPGTCTRSGIGSRSRVRTGASTRSSIRSPSAGSRSSRVRRTAVARGRRLSR